MTQPRNVVRNDRRALTLLLLAGLPIGASISMLAGTVPASGGQSDGYVAAIGGAKINGMTVSTPRGSSAWASDAMAATIAELKQLGVNWIAIHPYGWVGTDGEVSWMRPRRGRRGGANRTTDTSVPSEPPDWLRRPIEEARRQGVRILIKPHLDNWRDYEWRGAIRYDTEDEWERFFSTYRTWIVRLAEWSRGADAFAVGTELGGTVHHEEQWRRIVDEVRARFDGHLTYAANWDAYERVPFWGVLDSVGIQAYFPLLEQDDGKEPSQAALDAGWRAIMARVAAFSSRVGKPVVFTEAGYNNSPAAPYQPWDWETRGDAEELQVRCMIAALRAIDGEPSVLGAFLWKWYPGERLPRDFAMGAPHIRRLLREHWAGSDE